MERGSGHACRTITRTVTAHLSASRAGGSKRFPLLLFGLGIVLVVDLQGLLLYNHEQRVIWEEDEKDLAVYLLLLAVCS